MNVEPSHFLLIHGSIVFLIGLLTGLPFWLAIIRGREAALIRAWRATHTTLISSGLMMLIIGLAAPLLELDEAIRALMNWSLVISGYSFAVAFVAGATTGRRGLMPNPLGFNTLLFAAHFLGATGSAAGICLFLYGLL